MKRTDIPSAHCADPELAPLLQAACRASLTAGSLVRDLYAQPHTVRMKGIINLVTEADLAAEAAILASLAEDVPGIAVLAEESAPDIAVVQSGKVWVVDPLDGTNNYAHGFPYFGVSVALVEDSQPLVGAVYVPMLDELFCASRGGGAWLNGRPIMASTTDILINALIGTGFPYDIDRTLPDVMTLLERFLPRIRDLRRAGAAAVDLAYVACGRLDGFYEMELSPWDTAAAMLLVEEAGGRVSDFGGKPFNPFIPEIVASNGHLHTLLVDLLA